MKLSERLDNILETVSRMRAQACDYEQSIKRLNEGNDQYAKWLSEASQKLTELSEERENLLALVADMYLYMTSGNSVVDAKEVISRARMVLEKENKAQAEAVEEARP